jgi:hypothetical protein
MGIKRAFCDNQNFLNPSPKNYFNADADITFRFRNVVERAVLNFNYRNPNNTRGKDVLVEK